MSEEFAIGSKVRVVALPPYIKTAEPMPMLRPPDIIHVGEEGIVLDLVLEDTGASASQGERFS